MSDPTRPQTKSITTLRAAAMDVLLMDNTAIVAYANNQSELYDLSDPANPRSIGLLQGIGGRLFLYGKSLLFSSGAVSGDPGNALGGVHVANLYEQPFTITSINFTGDCGTILTPPPDPATGRPAEKTDAGCFNVYNDTVSGDTMGTASLSKNPVWQPGSSLPVGYVKGQTITLQVTMKQSPVPAVSPSGLKITGQAADGLSNCTWTGEWPLTPTFTFTCTMSAAKAKAYNAISWSYTSGGAKGYIGNTTNPIYVTLAPPLQYMNANYAGSSRKVYHTTLNLALSSNESTDQTSAFWNTWNQFSTGGPGPANIQTWQGRKRYYYRNDPNGTAGITIIGFNGCALGEESLLLNLDSNGTGSGHSSGQCGSFAYLLIGALAVNGVESDWATAKPVQAIGTRPAFLVNDWSPPDSNSGGPWSLCLNPGDFMVPAQPGGVYCDLTSKSTIPGQNTPPPSEKVFNKHFFVKPAVSGSNPLYATPPKYVDPSYGQTYDSEANFQKKAVFGYFDVDNPIGSVPDPNDPTHRLVKYSVSRAVDATTNITINP